MNPFDDLSLDEPPVRLTAHQLLHDGRARERARRVRRQVGVAVLAGVIAVAGVTAVPLLGSQGEGDDREAVAAPVPSSSATAEPAPPPTRPARATRLLGGDREAALLERVLGITLQLRNGYGDATGNGVFEGTQVVLSGGPIRVPVQELAFTCTARERAQSEVNSGKYDGEAVSTGVLPICSDSELPDGRQVNTVVQAPRPGTSDRATSITGQVLFPNGLLVSLSVTNNFPLPDGRSYRPQVTQLPFTPQQVTDAVVEASAAYYA